MQILCKSIVYIFHANFRQILSKSQATLEQLSGNSQVTLRQLSGNSQANLRHIYGKSQAYLRRIINQILGKYQAYLMHISCKSHAISSRMQISHKFHEDLTSILGRKPVPKKFSLLLGTN